jgi:hypothetical protein
MKKGAANVAKDWIGGLQEPSGLKCPERRLGVVEGLPEMPW